MKERIKNKLKDSKKISKPKTENADVKIDVKEEGEIEEYYLGKDRDDERKRKAYVNIYFFMRVTRALNTQS